MRLDPLDLVERLRGHVALAAVWAGNDRDVLDDEKGRALPKGPRESPVENSRLATDGAQVFRFLRHVLSTYPATYPVFRLGKSNAIGIPVTLE